MGVGAGSGILLLHRCSEVRGAALLEFGAHGFGRNAEAQGGLLRVFVHEHDVAGFMHGFGHGLQDGETALVGVVVLRGAKAVQIVIEKALGVLDEAP